MDNRVINFYAGPAGLPLTALERTRDELLNFEGTGMSVMEISHRSKEYDKVHNEAIELVRELLAVPANHHILLLQGGGNLQFAMVPMNLLRPGDRADYIVTGQWAENAYKEGQIVAGKDAVRVAGTTKEMGFKRLPKTSELDLDPKAAYVHLCSNNTIYGTQYKDFPDTGDVPLIADMSSDIMWRPFDVSKFGLIYAGAQKNLGPSGLVVAILRDDVLQRCRKDIATMLSYPTHVESNSLFNTPPTLSIYILRNVLAHNKAIGGLAAIEKANLCKADMLYSCIDKYPEFYKGYVTEKADRSTMNVDFNLPSEELDAAFVAGAKSEGMVGLKGYRSLGGVRVSLYNAVTVEQVKMLVGYMENFISRNG